MTPVARRRRQGALLGATLLASPMAACRDGAAPALSREEGAAILEVPAPAEGGARLLVVAHRTAVHGRPHPGSIRFGELRAGALVARSEKRYGKEGCKGGWYAVRPRGFVCAGPGVTLEPEKGPRVLAAPPELTRPLPYRYARARFDGVPVYPRPPTREEQAAAEPDLDKHLAASLRLDAEPVPLGAADVPLDPGGQPTGPRFLPTPAGPRPTAGAFFGFVAGAGAPQELPPPRAGKEDDGEEPGERARPRLLRKGSGVAITTTVLLGGRRFAVLPDGSLVPSDRLRPAPGTTYHGIDLGEIGLPIAFIHKLGVHPFTLEEGRAYKQENRVFERRTPVPMSGKFRTLGGVRFEQSREGFWLRAQDIIPVVRRSKLPEFAREGQKWLDVSIANQTLTAYEGKKPIFATLVSTGRDQLKDPQTSASTARGTFRVRGKSVARPLDPREVEGSFDVEDAPWALEFEAGHAVVGTYWGDGIGEPRTFHGVALAPLDAFRIFRWSDPPLPEGWHAVSDDGGPTTIVHVRP